MWAVAGTKDENGDTCWALGTRTGSWEERPVPEWRTKAAKEEAKWGRTKLAPQLCQPPVSMTQAQRTTSEVSSTQSWGYSQLSGLAEVNQVRCASSCTFQSPGTLYGCPPNSKNSHSKMNSSVQARGPMLENPSPHYTQEHTHTLPSGPLTGPTGRLRWRWTLLPFTAPPKTEEKHLSISPCSFCVNASTFEQQNLLISNKSERHVLKCLVMPASSPQRQSPLWSWRTGLLISHVRSNRPRGPEWLPCTCTTPGQPQYSEKARRCNHSSEGWPKRRARYQKLASASQGLQCLLGHMRQSISSDLLRIIPEAFWPPRISVRCWNTCLLIRSLSMLCSIQQDERNHKVQ